MGDNGISKRNNALDGLKGISALLIACVYHLNTVPFGYTAPLPFRDNFIMGRIYERGWIFVDFFFLISGYTAFMHYTTKIEEGMKFHEFIKRRMIRIFPLMWVTLFTAVTGEMIHYTVVGRFWINTGNNTIFTLF